MRNLKNIQKIEWTVKGKVKKIIQDVDSEKKYLTFDYDALGHRIAKHVYNNETNMLEKSTYYILDAQGNQVSMYEHVLENETVKYNLVENNIFGSSRIGNLNREMNVLNASISSGGTQVLGKKFYEFTNHLGNVLTVFTDLKIPQDTDNNNLVDNYLVGIVRSMDYSPFGVELDERTLSYEPPTVSNGTPTIIYQHKFDDSPSTHPYTGSPTSIDPNLTQVNWTNTRNSWTNYGGHTGRAIAINSTSQDTTRLYLNLSVNSGYYLDVTSYSFRHRSSPTGFANYNIYINNIFVGSGAIWVTSGSTLQSTGTVNVANAIAGLSGTVTVRLDLFNRVGPGTQGTFRMDDFVLNGYTTAMGDWNPRGYRYGFNGMESDPEFKGEGNSYTTEFRQYDARVGRWLSLDPLAFRYPEVSPYVSFYNNPILYIDVKGDSIKLYSRSENSWKVKGWLQTLTNDELTLNSCGTVVIKSKNSVNLEKKLTVGTMLIRSLIVHDKNLNIQFNNQFINNCVSLEPEKASNGEGTDVIVNFDRFNKLDFNTENPITLLTELKTTKNEFILAHELIHALRAMTGILRKQDNNSSHIFKGRNGNYFKETQQTEELETVGLIGNFKFTENKIRKEHGEAKRVSYSDEN